MPADPPTDAPVPILLVDDDPVALRHLEGVLARPGWELVSAASADHALGLLQRRDFAVVLLDLDLPGTNGFEAARLARAQPRSRDTPVIFVTAHAPHYPAAEAYRLGAVDYLAKPVDPVVLRAKVGVFADLFRTSRRVVELERLARGRAEGRLRQMVDSATDYAFFSVDPGGDVTYWNAGAERLFGWAEADVLGRSADVLYTPEDRAAGVPARERAEAADRGRAEDERWHLRRDGTRFFASGVVTPAPGGFTKVSRDVTDARRLTEYLRASEARQRFLADLAAATQPLADPDAVTATAARLLGGHLGADRCAYAEVEGEAVYVITGDHCRGVPSIVGRWPVAAFGAEHHRMMRADEAYVVHDAEADPRVSPADLPAYRAAGIRAVVCVPLHKGGKFTAAMAVHQSAPRRWTGAEVELVRVVAGRCWESLERARVGRELRLRADALAEADRRKDEFLATLAHELRNPLAPIRNALHMLELVGGGGEDPVARNAREVMERQVAHMVRLVDDLLDVSRVSRGKIELRREAVDLADVVRAAVETSGPLVRAAGHRLTVTLPDGPVGLDADPARLAQAVANVLNNAAKYTPPGGDIGVRAGAEGGQAVVRVRDTGVGIPPEMLPKVFDLFTQVDQSLNRSQGGLGLGLALVRSLVEMHGGVVEARSEGAGTGCEFVLRLPLPDGRPRPGASGAVTPPVIPPPPRRGLSVLLVEDNRDAADTLRAVLEAAGHRVEVAADGPGGVAAAKRLRPDAVVSDLGLPGLDGYGVARALRADPATAGALLISLSGYGQEADRRAAREAGFDHALVKPADPAALARLLADRARAGRP